MRARLASALAAALICAAGLLLIARPGAGNSSPAARSAEDGKLRVIAFGAHPDDCEIKAGGVGALWSARGARVKFVSTTNGDIGHWRDAGGPLANRRREEARKADEILGVESEVLDIHDGEILPTLENRKTIVRLIRSWGADLVLAPRPWDYHPDHRYTGVLVQDAAYMVTVPFFCPDVPHLRKNPVFLYYEDGFQRPYPFRPDIVVSIDSVIERKLDALAVMESQFLEGGCGGGPDLLPKTEEERQLGQRRVRERFRERFARTAEIHRAKLIELYGEARGKAVKYAEAFEVCEYGRQPSRDELRKLFPVD